MPRKSITGYNAQFIDLSVTIVGTITMVCYIIYTMNEGVIGRFGSPYIYLTNFWVLAGLLRYLQNMLVYQRSGSPTKVLVKDRFKKDFLSKKSHFIVFFVLQTDISPRMD